MPSRYAPKQRRQVSNAYRDRLGYDVLFDAGTPHELAEYFRYGACKVPADFHLRPKAKDVTIVARAETDQLMLVTHDSEMDEYVRAHQAGKKLHKCLSGLVRLPSGREKQTERLSAVARALDRSSSTEAQKPLIYNEIVVFWHDIWRYNFFVNLDVKGWPALEPLCDCGIDQFEKDLRAKRLLL